VDEARRQELPFILLRSVVPFIRIAEAANTLIVDRSGQRLRLGDSISRALNEALIAGAGVPGVLATAAESLGAPLVLVAENGALVAAHGVTGDRQAWQVAGEAASWPAPARPCPGRIWPTHWTARRSRWRSACCAPAARPARGTGRRRRC
jgi:hypothetical protein